MKEDSFYSYRRIIKTAIYLTIISVSLITEMNSKQIYIEMNRKHNKNENSFNISNTSKTSNRNNKELKEFTTREELINLLSLSKDNNENNKRQLSPYTYSNSDLAKKLSIDDLDKLKFTETAEEELKNFRNVQYFGYIYLGSKKSKHSVIFDTGSNILWLPSSDCESCRQYANTYDYSQSATFINYNESRNITYAVGYVEGQICSDMLSLENFNKNKKDRHEDIKIHDYNFLLVNKEKSLGNTVSDGVLGLGFSDEGDSHNSLILSLYNEDIISKPKFSVFLGDENETSRIYFGDIFSATDGDGNAVLNENDFSSCSVERGSSYWSCYIETLIIEGVDDGLGIYDDLDNKENELISNNKDDITNIKANITDNNVNNVNSNSGTNKTKSEIKNDNKSITLQPKSNSAVFDTGTSFLIIPYYDFLSIIPYFTNKAKENKCALTQFNQLVCKCNSDKDFPNIKLQIGTGSVSITTKDIITFDKTLLFQCEFQIMTTEDKFFNIWILGDSILRKLIVEFDLGNSVVNYIDKESLFNRSEKGTSLSAFIVLIIIYLFIFIVLVLIGLIIWKYLISPFVRGNNNNESNNNVEFCIRDAVEDRNIDRQDHSSNRNNNN